MGRGLQKGDRFIVTDAEMIPECTYSTSPYSGKYDRLRYGETIEVVAIIAGMPYYFDARGRLNLVPLQCVELRKEKDTHVTMTGVKVGDKFRVVCGQLVPGGCYSTDLSIYNKGGDKDRLQTGEIITVIGFRDGSPFYHNAKGNANRVPYEAVEPYKEPPPPKPPITIKKGDWVRAKKDSDWQRSSIFYRDFFLDPPRSWMKAGEIFQVEGVDEKLRLVEYMTGLRITASNLPVDDVEHLPNYDPYRRTKQGILVFLIMTPIAGVLSMNQLLETIASDPTVHKSIVTLIVVFSGFLSSALVWFGVKNGIKGTYEGMCKVSDRRRELKDMVEDVQLARQKELVAAAVKAATPGQIKV